jgi:site-specific DNA-methyltransferase (adenine-specific)
MFSDSIPVEYQNKIVVSDALVFLHRLPDACVPLYLFSPPYNLQNTTGGGMPGKRLGHYDPAGGMVARGGMGKWSGGALANGYSDHGDALPHAEYVAWQQAVLRECWRTLMPAGAIYYQHKPRVMNGLLVEPRDYVPPDLPIRQRVIWARAGGINFSPAFYLPTHEEILIICKPDFRLKSKGASGVGDTWYVPQEAGTWHPAPFPLALAQRVIETTMLGFVCDPFCGSGTTACAAKQCGIGFIGCDLSADYVARANERVAHTRRMTLRQAPLVEAAEQGVLW